MAHATLARSRSGRIIVLLLVTLGVAGAIGWEATRAAAAERMTTDAVLSDYASFAAWEYARAAGQQLHTSIEGTIARLGCAASTHGVEAALTVSESKPCDCGSAPTSVRTFFQRESSTAAWQVSGAPLSDEVRRVITASPSAEHMTPPEIRVISVAGRPSVLAWKTGHHNAGRSGMVRGFVADATSLEPVLAGVFKKATLLPETLLDRADAMTFLQVRVTDQTGRTLFATAGGASTFAGKAALGPGTSGLNVLVSLAPEAASQLIIGGLPRARLPWLYGLLALATGLVVLAVVQLRREAELGRLRANFISGVSHELRTPLAQIRMFAETLLLGRVRNDHEARRSLEIVLREAHRLSQLADNVLCFERSGRDSMALDRRDVDVGELLGEIVESFEPFADTRGASIRLEVPGAFHADADPSALRQIVVNLLDNALKYGPPAQTVVIAADSTPGGMRLRVDDEGPGVDERHRARVWEPFWRASGTAAGGSGIGLSIVRHLATLHGGRAWVETARSGGARFIVDLPAVAAAARSATRAPAPDTVRKTA